MLSLLVCQYCAGKLLATPFRGVLLGSRAVSTNSINSIIRWVPFPQSSET
jgi:hypothetical protein